MTEIYQDKQMLYIVTQECHGGNLLDRVIMKYKNGEHLSEQYVSKILKMIGDALILMHCLFDIFHYTFRPEKILFLSRHEDSPIKIIDFGISKVIHHIMQHAK